MRNLLPTAQIFKMRRIFLGVTAHALHDRRPGRMFRRIAHVRSGGAMTCPAADTGQLTCAAAPSGNESANHSKIAGMAFLAAGIDVKSAFLQCCERAGVARADPAV